MTWGTIVKYLIILWMDGFELDKDRGIQQLRKTAEKFTITIKDGCCTNFLPPTTECMPVKGRKYTMTHSDATRELFLSIGNQYNFNAAINFKIRDEVLAEWIQQNEQFNFWGKVHVNRGEFDENSSKKRFLIFEREAKLAK